ncbi:MAG: methyl-accepting chemotaxis protein [Clostridiales bacterium]|jgi:methyl-accepting chemotaxis protein|nr:methyl-accepting chemotaxis protein [Clostridiales bacterium]
MKFYENLKIRTRLIGSFVFVAILTLAVGAAGLICMANLNGIGRELTERHVVTLNHLAEIVETFQRSRADLRDIALTGDAARAAAVSEQITEAERLIDERLELLAATLPDTPEAVEGRLRFAESLRVYYEVQRGLIERFLSPAERGAAIAELLDGRYLESAQNVSDEIVTMQSSVAEWVADGTARRNAIERTGNAVVAVSALLAGLIGTALGLAISSDVSRGVSRISKAVERVADGDFTTEADVRGRDEFGMLAGSVNRMIRELSSVLARVDETAYVVDDAAKQVSSSSMSLAQISTEQASSVQQITATINDITARTKINAESAARATRLSEKARDSAIRGDGMMTEMLEAMRAINERSAGISSIIKVIDDIAFQTNILALNAAVEAARAGQHGKGFAVVAEEVRGLAARSAEAARETTQMIENGVSEVGRGSKIAAETADALKEIVEGISESAALAANISDESERQSQGADQINLGMNQLSQAIQTTSSVAQETASSSAELSEQAGVLSGLIDTFRIDCSAAKTAGPGAAGARRGATGMRPGGGGRPGGDGANSADVAAKPVPREIALTGGFGKY